MMELDSLIRWAKALDGSSELKRLVEWRMGNSSNAVEAGEEVPYAHVSTATTECLFRTIRQPELPTNKASYGGDMHGASYGRSVSAVSCAIIRGAKDDIEFLDPNGIGAPYIYGQLIDKGLDRYDHAVRAIVFTQTKRFFSDPKKCEAVEGWGYGWAQQEQTAYSVYRFDEVPLPVLIKGVDFQYNVNLNAELLKITATKNIQESVVSKLTELKRLFSESFFLDIYPYIEGDLLCNLQQPLDAFVISTNTEQSSGILVEFKACRDETCLAISTSGYGSIARIDFKVTCTEKGGDLSIDDYRGTLPMIEAMVSDLLRSWGSGNTKQDILRRLEFEKEKRDLGR